MLYKTAAQGAAACLLISYGPNVPGWFGYNISWFIESNALSETVIIFKYSWAHVADVSFIACGYSQALLHKNLFIRAALTVC